MELAPKFEGAVEDKDEFAHAVEETVEEGLRLVRERFEEVCDSGDCLDYHNSEHTQKVLERVEKMIEAIRSVSPETISDREAALARIAAAFHDTVQKWEPSVVSEGVFTKKVRKRFAGDNEKMSSDPAIQYLKEINQEKGKEIFTGEDMLALSQAIEVTTPAFDLERKTVVQPNLSKESPAGVRLVALADLGAAGIDGPEQYAKEGDALFREENLDIREALQNLENIPDDHKEYFRKRMLGWSKFQPLFAQGRKDLLGRELDGLPDKAREAIEKLFCHFDETIEAGKDLAAKRENMTFEEMARDFGYIV